MNIADLSVQFQDLDTSWKIVIGRYERACQEVQCRLDGYEDDQMEYWVERRGKSKASVTSLFKARKEVLDK